MTRATNRREFVASAGSALGGGWLWLNLPALAALSACSGEAARRGEALTTLTAAEGAAMGGFAARLVPAEDGLPGAEEAGAVWFADRALGSFFAGMLPAVRAGLADLDARARADHGRAFAALDEAGRDAIIHEVRDTEFFESARLLVLAGVFADPGYGGNRAEAGARITGVTHAAGYRPPFGWYDAQAEGTL
jgi:gluconate 2-dehydrogenase gamma chain